MCGLRCSNCGAKSWLQVGCLALCSFNLLEHPCVNKWYSWSFSEAHAVTHLWPMSVYVEFLDHNAQCWTQVWCEMLHYYVHVCVDRPKSLTDRNVRVWFGTQSWANVGTVYWDSRCSAVCSQHFNMSLLLFYCFWHRHLQVWWFVAAAAFEACSLHMSSWCAAVDKDTKYKLYTHRKNWLLNIESSWSSPCGLNETWFPVWTCTFWLFACLWFKCIFAFCRLPCLCPAIVKHLPCSLCWTWSVSRQLPPSSMSLEVAWLWCTLSHLSWVWVAWPSIQTHSMCPQTLRS